MINIEDVGGAYVVTKVGTGAKATGRGFCQAGLKRRQPNEDAEKPVRPIEVSASSRMHDSAYVFQDGRSMTGPRLVCVALEPGQGAALTALVPRA